MTKKLIIFWDDSDPGWAWKTKTENAAIVELTDLFDVLAEEGAGARLVVIDKTGKTHKGPKAALALPFFGGKKPKGGSSVWSWDAEQVLRSRCGTLILEDRKG